MTHFSDLLGLTLKQINVSSTGGDDEILFTAIDGRVFRMYHKQSCCESVSLESIVGEMADLIGSPILKAEESTSEQTPEGFTHKYEPESQTWTFYKLATIRGYVDIRWFGSSNGYYSESVDFEEVTPPLLDAAIFTLDEAETFLNAAREEGLWYRDAPSDVEGGLGYVVSTPADLGLRWRCPLHISTSTALDTVAVARIIQDSIKRAIKARARALEAP